MSAPRPGRVAGSCGIDLAIETHAVDRPAGDARDPRGRAVLLVHATGFCKEVWYPVVEELRLREVTNPLIALDQACHGDSGRRAHPFDWSDGAGDVLAMVGAERGLFGLGHSSGAAHLLLAEIARPGTFSGLVVVEPIVFPPPHARHEHSPLVEGALRRRYRFGSPVGAMEAFRGRGPFARWDERALEAYCTHGLRPEGSAWALKCHPEDEAEYYRTGSAHDGWDHLGEISCPVVLVAGSDSTTHPPPFVAALADRIESVEVVSVPSATHFVPMERPDAVADAAARLIGSTPVTTENVTPSG